MLNARGYNDPFDAYASLVSCTLVSKKDGRVVSLTNENPSSNGHDDWNNDLAVHLTEPSDDIGKGFVEFFVGTDRLFIRIRPKLYSTGELAPDSDENLKEKLIGKLRWLF